MPRFVVIARDPLIADEGAARHLPADVPVERYRVVDLDLDQIFEQLTARDLFASARAIHYVDFLALKLPGKKDGERLRGIFDGIPAETTLVCSQVLDYQTRGEEKRVLNSQTWERWTTGSDIDDLRHLCEGTNAAEWVRQRARQKYGLALEGRQIELLLTANDDRPALVDTELQKLWMLKTTDEPQPISDNMLGAALSSSPGARFYELVDALLTAAPDAQQRLAAWFRIEPETFRLLAVLNRRLLDILALKRGEKPGSPFLARQLRHLAARWTEPGLKSALSDLARVEFELKSGLIPGETSKQGELSALQLLTVALAEAG